MAKTLVLAFAALLAAVLTLGRSAAADAEAASIDMVLQTAFVQDVEGFCVAPIPACLSVCEGPPTCFAWAWCDDAACTTPFGCVVLDTQALCCGINPYVICDCV